MKPCWFNFFQMLAEFQRIIGSDVVSYAKATWQEYCPKIIAQAKLERGTRITKAVLEFMEDENGEHVTISNYS